MTKLEKIIYDAIELEDSERGMMLSCQKNLLSEAVAAAVLPLIEEAFDAGRDFEHASFNNLASGEIINVPDKEQYLSELSGNTEQLKEKNKQL